MQVEIKLLMGLKTDFFRCIFYILPTFIHQYRVASYCRTKHTEIKKQESTKHQACATSHYQKFIFMASVGLVSNRISDRSYSGSLCTFPSPLDYSAKTQKPLVCICLGKMTLIFPDLPKPLQKPPTFPSTSFVYLFVPVWDWVQLQQSAWSDLISSTDVWCSQFPLFADVCCRISPCKACNFCFVLLWVLFPFATLANTADCFLV